MLDANAAEPSGFRSGHHDRAIATGTSVATGGSRESRPARAECLVPRGMPHCWSMYHRVMRVTLKTDKRGRVTLPPEVRDAAGFSPHMDLVVEVGDNMVMLRDATAERKAILKAARGQFAGAGGGTEELFASRRAEFAQEEAERRERSGRRS